MNGNGKQKEKALAKPESSGVPAFSLALAHNIALAAWKCRDDDDPTPHVIVIDRGELGYAQNVWTAICGPDSDSSKLTMDILPDMRTRGTRVVLLISRARSDAGTTD